MFHKDPLLTENISAHSPHSLIPSLIKPHSKVLDVGCNTGYMAKRLTEKKCVCDGIDVNTEALEQAKKYCRHTYQRDLYIGKLNLEKNVYDYIIFADLLEHLPRPDLILTDAKQYLKNTGKIIISMPNIARIEIRAKLLFGMFDYTDGGILSQDHLRFFTKSSAIRMIEACGYQVVKTIPTGLGHMFNVLPTLTAFQFIYVCRL